MSEHSSRHEFAAGSKYPEWCAYLPEGEHYPCMLLRSASVHAQAEPLESAEKKWREWWNLCKDGSTDNMNIRKNSLKALIEELSQAQRRIKELEEETQR